MLAIALVVKIALASRCYICIANTSALCFALALLALNLRAYNSTTTENVNAKHPNMFHEQFDQWFHM